MDVYYFRDWGEHYENNRTRRVSGCSGWALLPNSLENPVLKSVLSHRRGVEHFGVFCILLTMASHQHKPNRGHLLKDDGRAHTIASIARRTGIQEKTVRAVIKRLLDVDDVGCLLVVRRTSPDLPPDMSPTGSFPVETMPFDLPPDTERAYIATVTLMLGLHGSKVSVPPDQTKWKKAFDRMARVDFKDYGGLNGLVHTLNWLFTSGDPDALFWRDNVYSILALRHNKKAGDPFKILKIHTAYLRNNPGMAKVYEKQKIEKPSEPEEDLDPMRLAWLESLESRDVDDFGVYSSEHKAIQIVSTDEGAVGFLGVATSPGRVYLGYARPVLNGCKDAIRERTRSFFGSESIKVTLMAPEG